jgi:hypothetical protein
VILTELQAKEKACCGPQVHPAPEPGGIRRLPCAASGCMAWRWWDGDKTRGYCGLGGQP